MYKNPIVEIAHGESSLSPEDIIWNNWQIMHHKNGSENMTIPGKIKMKNFLKLVASQPHHGILEFVHFNFAITNVSRAFQQQLTRHRTASYIIQSLRIVKCEDFASEYNYHMPKEIIELNEDDSFHSAMMDIQDHYKALLTSGARQEDARGILPLNVFSPINMSINMRNLIFMMKQRSTQNTQSEFRMVIDTMKKELAKCYPLLSSIFFKEV